MTGHNTPISDGNTLKVCDASCGHGGKRCLLIDQCWRRQKPALCRAESRNKIPHLNLVLSFQKQ